uniref:Uncharacterized protein n=1 Tax=Rhizophora mucronata TaxID=61149 RepID=A0A2P2NTN4_RHIMU
MQLISHSQNSSITILALKLPRSHPKPNQSETTLMLLSM